MTTLQPSTESLPENPVASDRDGHGFLFLSLISLVLGTGLLVAQSSTLLSSPLTPSGQAWVELMIYGCAFSGVFGLCYRALPLVFAAPLFSHRSVFVHLAFHLVGTILILANFPAIGLASGLFGPILVFCGALIFAINIGITLNGIALPDAATAFLSTTLLWLLIVLSLGIPFATKPPLALFLTNGWSAGWIVLALVGVVLNAVFGITLRATPRALGQDPFSSMTAWYAFGLTNIGLAWLSTALALAPLPAVVLCASFHLIGSLVFLSILGGMIQNRTSLFLPWDIKFLLLSVSLLFVPVSFLFYAVWQRMNIIPPDPELIEATVATADPAAQATSALEFFPVDGAILLTLLLAIVVPALIALMFQFLFLEATSAPATQETNFRNHLGSQILLSSFFNYAVGVMMVVPAAWAGIERIVNLGTLFLVVGAAGFLGNYFYLGRAISPKAASLATGKSRISESKA